MLTLRRGLVYLFLGYTSTSKTVDKVPRFFYCTQVLLFYNSFCFYQILIKSNNIRHALSLGLVSFALRN